MLINLILDEFVTCVSAFDGVRTLNFALFTTDAAFPWEVDLGPYFEQQPAPELKADRNLRIHNLRVEKVEKPSHLRLWFEDAKNEFSGVALDYTWEWLWLN